jgi:hypothetical protein
MSERYSRRFSATRITTLVAFCAAMVISSHAQTFTKLVDLTRTTGEFPASPLVLGLDGNLYGTTVECRRVRWRLVFSAHSVGDVYQAL